MAIIIPSKNIFSKSFDPVVDNNIDRVEVEVKKIISDNRYGESVYNEDIIENINIKPYFDNSIYKIERQDYQSTTYQQHTVYLAEIVTRQRYITKTIRIPKEQNNSYIKDIFSGLDKNGNPNIGVALFGEKYTSNNAIDTFEAYFNSAGIISDTQSYHNIAGSAPHNNYTETFTEIPLELEYETTITNNTNDTVDVKVTQKLNNNSNISTANFSEETEIIDGKQVEFYKITLKILSDLKIYKCKGFDTRSGGANAFQNVYVDFDMNGIYEEYLSTKISITFYGNLIKINLQDESLIIGNGNNVFSFDGNELIQTTNTPDIETKYQGIIDKWKNGKQTAVITCPIADYYDTSENKIISKEGFEITNPVTIEIGNLQGSGIDTYTYTLNYISAQIAVGDKLYYNGEQAELTNYNLMYNKYELEFLRNGKFANMIGKGQFIVNKGESDKFPMIFHKGDIVVPYTYTNKGDKPMSYNKDFTPKQFKVVGTHISKSQGGMQELTLQEV